MFGGRSLRSMYRPTGWLAASLVLSAMAVEALAQAPIVDAYAPSEAGMSPMVSASDLPAAQYREVPLFPGEDPNPPLIPGLRTRLDSVDTTVGDIRTVSRCTDSSCTDSGCVDHGGTDAPMVSGCTDCGLIGDDCGCGMPFTMPAFPAQRRFDYFYEWLYMRTRNTDVAYAVPVDGPAAAGGGGVQVGPVAVIGQDYESQDGYRIGGSLLLNDGAQIGGSYTTFENIMTDQVFTQAPDVLRSLLNHPLSGNATIDTLRADARYEVEFELADLFYQAHLFLNGRTTVDYTLGLRYAELNQRLNANYDTNGVTSIATNVAFHGFGPRVGLGLDHQVGCFGLSVYSKGSATFIPGTGRGHYTQQDTFGGTVANTDWDSGCIMTQLDFELGLGLTPCRFFKISAGYLVSAWLNTTTTNEFVNAVQENDFNSINGDGLTFDGLVLRADFVF